MFKVKLGKREFEVSFKHSIPSKGDYQIMKDNPVEFRDLYGTECIIDEFVFSMDVPPITLRQCIGYGWADLSIKDQFNRDKGRKVSLARAIQGAHLPKDERELIWKTYNDTVGAKNKWTQS